MLLFLLACLCRKYPATSLVLISSLFCPPLAAQDKRIGFDVHSRMEGVKQTITCFRHTGGSRFGIGTEPKVTAYVILQIWAYTWTCGVKIAPVLFSWLHTVLYLQPRKHSANRTDRTW